MRIGAENPMLRYLNPSLVGAVRNGSILGDFQFRETLAHSPLIFPNLGFNDQNEEFGRGFVKMLQKTGIECRLLKPDANIKIIVQPLTDPRNQSSEYYFRMGNEGCAECSLAQLCGKCLLSPKGLDFYRQIDPNTYHGLDQQVAVFSWLDALRPSR